MRDWLALSVYSLTALWILLAGAAAFLRRRSRPGPPGKRAAFPTRQGLRPLARILAAAGSSPYARDRVQERLKLLAFDLEALERGIDPARHARGIPLEHDELLRAYFEEDHAGFQGRTAKAPAPARDFLGRTEEALHRLERHRHDEKGDRS